MELEHTLAHLTSGAMDIDNLTGLNITALDDALLAVVLDMIRTLTSPAAHLAEGVSPSAVRLAHRRVFGTREDVISRSQAFIRENRVMPCLAVLRLPDPAAPSPSASLFAFEYCGFPNAQSPCFIA